jgi:hypothetical protein
MKSWGRTISCLVVAAILECGFGSMALSQLESDPSAEKLSEVVRKSKILKPDSPLQIVIEGKEVRITTLRGAKSTDQDCKIDAALIAKNIFEAFPKKITRVKTQFGSPEKNALDQVTVTEGDVKAFGSGAISENELLSSLELLNVISESKTESNRIGVKAGPFEPQRSLLSMNIERLKSKGTNVMAFQKLFDQIENSLATENRGAIERQIDDLSQKLREQDQLVKQAGNISDGYSNRGGGTLRQRFGRFGSMGNLPGPGQPTLSSTGDRPNQRIDNSSSPATPGVAPLKGMTLYMKTRQKLHSMHEEGQNVSGYKAQMSEVDRLFMSGKQLEGRNMLQNVAHSLGISE